MGWQDMLSSAIDLAKKDPGGMMQYGLAGLYIKDQMAKQTGRENGERPGAICPENCNLNTSFCESCLQEQKVIIDSMAILQEIDAKIAAMKNNPNVVNVENKVIKCSLCGAPFEKGEKVCSYCNTPYPKEAFLMDIPADVLGQESYLLDKCVETYTLYAEWESRRANKTSNYLASTNQILAKVTSGLTQMASSKLHMDASQIKRGASHYGVDYVEYIAGVMTGAYKVAFSLDLEETQARNRAYHERNMQIEREKNEKLRKINQERNQAMGNLFYSKHVDWGAANSTKHECWNCYYYVRTNNLCTRTNCTTNSSHCCTCWK